MTMTPLQAYEAAVQSEQIRLDREQKKAMQALNQVYSHLLDRHKFMQQRPGLVQKIQTKLFRTRQQHIPGVYFWGGVGRGKTFMVDLFFECLPFDQKIRMHFHRFMQMVHDELKQLKETENPLKRIADNIASDTMIICLDEFHVEDITDAMLLAGLFEGLFQRGVTLVTSSNQHPDNLYSGGLQRERFLPAIELLKQYTQVMNVDAGTDYRLEYLDRAEIYHHPLDSSAEEMLLTNFEHLAPDTGARNQRVEVLGRCIDTVRVGDGVAWFEFEALCGGPRSAADYIEIARYYQTILLANLPVMDDMEVDKTKRFMTLIDEFYDRNVKLIITAETEASQIYTGSRLAEPFRRTISRLTEMATHDYLARPHLP